MKTKLMILAALLAMAAPAARAEQNLWDLARQNAQVHRFSTLITAQDVRRLLADEAGIDQAIDWCRRTAVTKIYLEEYRGGFQAERATLERARDRFRAAGIEVSGCITTTRVGKVSTGWSEVCCYTDPATQLKLKAAFEFAAGLFDEIMIDDFWFTDCTCPECEAARKARTVTIGEHKFPVAGDGWAEYRCELLVQLSRLYILDAARKVNPRVKIIIKYPQWYDRFHERGYEVARQTADFDRTWVGTETRDYEDKQWGGTAQYEAYFIMRWLGGIGGAKCGGGWYDPYGTHEATYLEQARQTVLGGARESMLFCYGALLKETGPQNVAALRTQIPELLRVAGEVSRRAIVGIAAYKPVNSPPENEHCVFDFVGMLGLPLVPCHEFPTEAPAAFFSVHALKDPAFAEKLDRYIATGRPVLLTDELARRLAGKVMLNVANVHRLEVQGKPKGLLELPQATLDAMRAPLLAPLKADFKAPGRVGLYLFQDGSWVIENFNDRPVQTQLNGRTHTIPARGWQYEWKRAGQ